MCKPVLSDLRMQPSIPLCSVHTHMDTGVYTNTPGAFLYSLILSFLLFKKKKKKSKEKAKARSFMKLPEGHFLKELGCHGLPDAYLPPVLFC